ncbi:MAG TPA: ABC transporter permease, partial [Gemmatimonadaceae bacterium]
MTDKNRNDEVRRAGAARGEWGYRLLLRVYPPRFRRRYAADMLAFYRERIATTGGDIRGMLAVWAQLIPDLFATACAEWMAPLHREVERAPVVISVYSNRREAGMSILVQDIRYALRSMIRRPAFTVVVLATLALGIGANAAIFTVVNAVLLRPLPYAQQERIVSLSNGEPYGNISEPEFVDYQRGIAAFEKLSAYVANDVTIAVGHDEPTRSTATRVSRDFFSILGVRPQLGRVFTADEFLPQSQLRAAVISHRLWMQQFAGDPNVVGKTLFLNSVPVSIIGVMPDRFAFPDAETTIWTAWRMNPDSLWTRNNHYMGAVGLLGVGKTIDQAHVQALTLNAQWMHDYPDMYDAKQPVKSSVTPIGDLMLGPTRPYLLALLGAVGFILLIACVNVANLLLVRGEGRRKEFAIRTALGASHGRMIRQALTESLLFAICGAAIGLVLAWVGVGMLTSMAPTDLPRLEQVGVDYRVVLFTTAITILTGIVFGLVPALRGIRDR